MYTIQSSCAPCVLFSTMINWRYRQGLLLSNDTHWNRDTAICPQDRISTWWFFQLVIPSNIINLWCITSNSSLEELTVLHDVLRNSFRHKHTHALCFITQFWWQAQTNFLHWNLIWRNILIVNQICIRSTTLLQFAIEQVLSSRLSICYI